MTEPEFKSMDDVAHRIVTLEAENKFLRLVAVLAIVIAVCEVASRFLH